MKGSVFKRKLPSGRVVWIASLDIGRDERGTRIRITKSFGRKGEAQDALDEIKRQQRDGLLVKPSPKTVREHFEEWLREHAAMHCSPKTAERYGELLAYVLPNLGDVPLCDLSTLMLERAYNKLRRGGGKGGRPLSARTVKNVHDTVRSALGKALKWKVLGTNPSIDCELPKGENPEARVLEKAEIEWLLDAVRGHPWLYVLFLVACATGCRRGELLALAWPDIDFTSGILAVSKSLEQTESGLRLKSTKSERPRGISLPATAIEALQDHRKAQQQLRDAFVGDYRTDLDLVFASPAGEYLKPDSVTAKVCLVAQQCGLKGVGLHSFRHTHGSQLLAKGVSLPAVSKRLGHSSVDTTAKVYAHVFAEDDANAARVWEADVGAALRAGGTLVAAHGCTGPVQ